MTGELKKYYLKHKAEPLTYAVEADERGHVLAALDVSGDETSGGLCPHILPSLPLAGGMDDVEMLNKQRAEFNLFEPECGNTHHLLKDLLEMEREYRGSTQRWESADRNAKSLKKIMEEDGEKVHQLLMKIQDRKPLPLFAGIGESAH